MVKPRGNKLPPNLEDIFKEASRCNGDGMGLAIPSGIFKSNKIGYSDFAKIALENITEEDPAIIHFRLGTSGAMDRSNCHPFVLKDGTIFAHNGIVSSKFPSRGDKSDTAMLAENSPDYDALWNNCLELVSSCNKFAIMHPQRTKNSETGVDIIGEHYGNWDNGIWFSNNSWRPSSISVPARFHYSPTVPTNTDPSVTKQVADLVNKFGYTNVQNALWKVKAWVEC